MQLNSQLSHFGCKYDQQATENVHEIQKEAHRVPDVVIVSTLKLLNNELSVKQNEPTENE